MDHFNRPAPAARSPAERHRLDWRLVTAEEGGADALWAAAAPDHWRRLSAGSRRARFAGEVAPSALDRLAARQGAPTVWLASVDAAGAIGASGELREIPQGGALAQSVDDGVRRCGVARMIGASGKLRNIPRAAELALSVEDGLQRHGVGRTLFRRLIEAALGRGFDRVVLATTRENAGIARIVAPLANCGRARASRKFTDVTWTITLSGWPGNDAGTPERLSSAA